MIRNWNEWRWRTAAGAVLLGASGIVGAAVVSSGGGSQALAMDSITSIDLANAAVFIKYDGIDGEAQDANHDKWIDVLSIDWGVAEKRSRSGRRRGGAIVEDVTLTMEIDKSTPKLMEACLMGKVLPKLTFDATEVSPAGDQTYLRYELTNVLVTSYRFHSGGEGEPPTMVVGNNFEKVKVTYTEFDDKGSSQGNVEVEWKVEKGSK